MQRFVAFLQRPHGMLLGLVLDEALVFNGVLPGVEGGVEIHARQYAMSATWRCLARHISLWERAWSGCVPTKAPWQPIYSLNVTASSPAIRIAAHSTGRYLKGKEVDKEGA